MLGQIVLIHLFELPLQLFLLLIQQLHVHFQELLHIQVVVTSAPRLRHRIKILILISIPRHLLSSQTPRPRVLQRLLLLRILIQITQLSIGSGRLQRCPLRILLLLLVLSIQLSETLARNTAWGRAGQVRL